MWSHGLKALVLFSLAPNFPLESNFEMRDLFSDVKHWRSLWSMPGKEEKEEDAACFHRLPTLPLFDLTRWQRERIESGDYDCDCTHTAMGNGRRR